MVLEDYLRRDDVSQFIEQIKTNERYHTKSKMDYSNPSLSVSYELALFIFYDALLKYKIIIDDIYLFDEYLEQLEKLYRKLDGFENIRVGIHKLIVRTISIQKGIRDLHSEEARRMILSTVYESYIRNGYFIHGFSSSYYDAIQEDGFVPEQYENYYDQMQVINAIFSKYNISSAISKDFSSSKVFFTDDMVMGCYYSMYSPMYFFQFLTNQEIFGKRCRIENYLIDDFSLLIRPLKRFMSNQMFHESDRSMVLSIIEKEWNLLHRGERKISLMLVPRKELASSEVSLEEFLKDDGDIYEVVDRLLSSKYNNISSDKVFSPDDFSLISLDAYSSLKEESFSEKEEEEEAYRMKLEEVNREFLNTYGSVSILLLLGSSLISFGVILTIITIILS